MEKALMDLMYRIPSDSTIKKCIITKEVIDGTGEPVLERGEASAQGRQGQRKGSGRRRKGGPETA